MQAGINDRKRDLFELSVERSGEAVMWLDEEARIVYANDAACRLLGYTGDELSALRVFDVDADITEDAWPARWAKLKERGSDKIESRHRDKSGRVFPVEVTGNYVELEGRGFNCVSVRDVSERRRAEQVQASLYKISEAAHSADNLNDLFKAIHDIITELMPAKDNFYIALYDEDSNFLSFPYFVDEFDPAPLPKKPGKGLTEYVLRTGRPLLASPEVFENLERRGEVESIGAPSIDWLGVPLKLSEKTIGVLVVQSYTEGFRYTEEEKSVLMFISEQVAMAITRRKAEEQIKASLKEKEVLLREIHHRVKNNLQIISSLLSLQSQHVRDPADLEMFKESRLRVRSMAMVHEKLYRSRDLSQVDFKEYLHSLVFHLFQIYGVTSENIDLKLEVENVSLDISTAIPCALLVSELISNAMKHAFPGRRRGTVTVGMKSLEEGTIELKVSDNGIGLKEEFDLKKSDSFGLQLVDMLAEQLQGSISIQGNGGATFAVRFRRQNPD